MILLIAQIQPAVAPRTQEGVHPWLQSGADPAEPVAAEVAVGVWVAVVGPRFLIAVVEFASVLVPVLDICRKFFEQSAVLLEESRKRPVVALETPASLLVKLRSVRFDW